jgi:hypothetical protein
VRSRSANDLAAATRAEFKRYRDRALEHVRHLDALIEGCAEMLQLDPAVLRQQREERQALADRITAQLRSRSWVYFGLLQEAENAGIKLSYTAPPQGKPYGPGIEHLIAAAARHGHQIGPDRACGLIKQFNALARTRMSATLHGEGLVQVDIDVVHHGLWFWQWLV